MLISLLYNIFYLMPILFIWSEIYHIKNRDRLYIRFNQRQFGSSTKIDYIFYLTKVLYLLWIVVGIFSAKSNLFLLILLVSAIRYLILLFKSKKFNDIYDIVSSFICIAILAYILFRGLFF